MNPENVSTSSRRHPEKLSSPDLSEGTISRSWTLNHRPVRTDKMRACALLQAGAQSGLIIEGQAKILRRVSEICFADYSSRKGAFTSQYPFKSYLYEEPLRGALQEMIAKTTETLARRKGCHGRAINYIAAALAKLDRYEPELMEVISAKVQSSLDKQMQELQKEGLWHVPSLRRFYSKAGERRAVGASDLCSVIRLFAVSETIDAALFTKTAEFLVQAGSLFGQQSFSPYQPWQVAIVAHSFASLALPLEESLRKKLADTLLKFAEATLENPNSNWQQHHAAMFAWSLAYLDPETCHNWIVVWRTIGTLADSFYHPADMHALHTAEIIAGATRAQIPDQFDQLEHAPRAQSAFEESVQATLQELQSQGLTLDFVANVLWCHIETDFLLVIEPKDGPQKFLTIECDDHYSHGFSRFCGAVIPDHRKGRDTIQRRAFLKTGIDQVVHINADEWYGAQKQNRSAYLRQLLLATPNSQAPQIIEVKTTPEKSQAT